MFETMERNNDSDFGDGTTSTMSNMSISNDTSEVPDLKRDDKDKELPLGLVQFLLRELRC